jgi:hypothetical protein
MKFLTPITALATTLAVRGLAAGAIRSDDQNCPFGGNWNYCDVDDTYTVCVNGSPTWFSCDGGCQPFCLTEGGTCQMRCDNAMPTSALVIPAQPSLGSRLG